MLPDVLEARLLMKSQFVTTPWKVQRHHTLAPPPGPVVTLFVKRQLAKMKPNTSRTDRSMAPPLRVWLALRKVNPSIPISLEMKVPSSNRDRACVLAFVRSTIELRRTRLDQSKPEPPVQPG